MPESVFDGNGNDANNGAFLNFVQEWRNTEDLVLGPSLTAPSATQRPAFVAASTGGVAENYLSADGSDDTLEYTAGLTNQSFTIYFALQSFLNPAQNHQYKSFMSTGTSPGTHGTWQLDMSTGGTGIDRCPTTNYFSWRMNDGGTHYRLCGRPLDNNLHSFYLTYNAVTKEAKFFMDGVLFDSRIVNNQVNVDLIKLWRNRAGGSYQQGYIYEYGMLNFAETDFTDLADYLNCKWATVSDDMDIQITIVPSVINPNLGDTVTYTVTVLNNGPNGASDIDVSSVIPGGLTYVPASIAGGAARNDSSPSGSGLTWTAAPLLSGESDVLTFQATVNSFGELGIKKSSAQITDYIGLDVDTGNNTDTGQIRVQGVDLSVSKTASTTAPGLGQQVDYTITVSNLGTDTATGVELTDILDPRLTYIGSSATGGVSVDDSAPGTGIVWTLGTINSGQTVTLNFSATPNTVATIPNSAVVTAVDQPEGDVSNNTGSVSVAVGAVDLNVSIAASSTIVNEGDTITFTISAQNISAQALTTAEIRSVVPIGFSYVAASASGGVSQNDSNPYTTGIRLYTGAVSAGATVSFTYQVTVNTGVALNYGTRTVEGHLQTSNPGDQNGSNNSANITITIVNFDAGITKTANPTTAAEGETITYTLVVNNAQENILTNILVRDIIPSGLTYVASSWSSSIAGTVANEADPSGAGLEFTIPQLQEVSNAPLNQAVITFDVTVDAGAAMLGSIQNTGDIISLTETDTNASNDTSSVSITPITFDAGISQVVSTSTPEEGETITFTLTVINNNATAVGTNIVVTDIIPAGLTYVGSSITGGDSNNAADPSGAGLSWTINSLAGGASLDLTFQATVDAGAKGTYGTITNMGAIASLDQVDSVSANDNAQQVLTITGLDLGVSKSVDINDPIEGQDITYTVTVTNNSTQTATNLVITDVVPSGVTYVAASIAGGTSSDDTNPDTTGLTWTIASIAGGANAVLTFHATVDAGAFTNFPTIVNTANLTSLNETEEVPGNNSGAVTINIKSFDIAVSKSVDNATPEEGEEVTYTITVENTTVGVAGTNIVITDIVPAGVTYVPASITGGTTNDATNPGTTGLTWNIASLAAGATTSLSFSATVDAGAKGTYGSVLNTATLTSLDQVDSINGNDSGTALITIVGLDLSVAKSVNVSDPVEGDTITYSITVTNTSSQTATAVNVRDIVPNGVTYVAASIAGGDTTNDTSPAGTGLTWVVNSIAGGANAVLTFQATVDGGAVALNPITNSAELVSIAETEDNPANNTGTVDINAKSFDLSIVKSVDNANPEEGEEITYTLTVTNTTVGVTGTNISVSDVVPVGVTYVGASITGGDTSSEADPTGTGLNWTISSLAGGASTVFTFKATVDTGAKATYGTILNTATIDSSDQIDSIPGNDSGQSSITVKGLDISVSKAVNIPAPTEGDEIIYTVTVLNTSSQTATGVNVRDIVPNGVTYVGASILGGDTRDDANPDTTGLTWTVNSLAGGASEVLTFRATVDAGAISLSPITNSANLLGINETEDNSGNNTGTVDINVKAFDIAVTKVASSPTAEEGEAFTYTINVENTTADVTGTNIVITDIVPAGVTYVAASITGGTTSDDTNPGTTGLTWNIASLAAGATASLSFQVTVDSGAKATYGTVTNTAVLTSSDQIDSISANDNGISIVTLVGLDIEVTKVVSVSDPVEGDTVTYTITVNNTSGQPATGINIRDIVPNGVTYVVTSIAGGDSRNAISPAGTGLTWVINTLAGGASTNLTFDATVDAGAVALNPITNSAELVSINETEDNIGNNTGTVDINAKSFDLGIAKSVDNANPEEGEEITYTLTVTNTTVGVTGTNISVSDVIPAGVTYVGASITGGDTSSEADPTGTGLNWTISSLAGGASAVFTFKATVDTGAKATYGTISNTATIDSSDQIDSIPGNDSGQVSIAVKGLDIEITKAVSVADPVEGNQITYTITVNNTSSQTATAINVSDVVPNGVTYVATSIAGGDTRNDTN
ncbi:MAG: isopeptide-forming domain-containing fimbrial protein, partial [Bdellovibrionales bacterium]